MFENDALRSAKEVGLACKGGDGRGRTADVGTDASRWVDVTAGDTGLRSGLCVLWTSEIKFLFNAYILNITTVMAEILTLG